MGIHRRVVVRQFLSGVHEEGCVSNRFYAPILICMMLMVSGVPDAEREQVGELENRRWTDSNDGYGPINYTNEHTTATITSEGRPATLTMPGGMSTINLFPWSSLCTGTPVPDLSTHGG